MKEQINETSEIHLRSVDQMTNMKYVGSFVINPKPQKVKLNNSVSAVSTYEDMLYLGTSSSQVLVYKIKNKCVKKSDEFKVQYEGQFYPHCEVVASLVINQKFIIVIPKEEGNSLLKIWDRNTLKMHLGYKGHKRQISKVIFLQNQQYIATSSYDGTVGLWKLSHKEVQDQHQKLYLGKCPIIEMKEIDEEVLCIGGDDCYLTIWNWKKEEILFNQFGHSGSVLFIEIQFPYVVTTGGDSKFKIWHLEKKVITPEILQTNPMAVFYPDYKLNKIKDLKVKKRFQNSVMGHRLQQEKGFNSILILDRRGKAYYLDNRNQNVLQQALEIPYNQTIISSCVYNNRILMVNNKEKLITATFQEIKNQSEKSITSEIKSIFKIQNNQKVSKFTTKQIKLEPIKIKSQNQSINKTENQIFRNKSLTEELVKKKQASTFRSKNENESFNELLPSNSQKIGQMSLHDEI